MRLIELSISTRIFTALHFCGLYIVFFFRVLEFSALIMQLITALFITKLFDMFVVNWTAREMWKHRGQI